MYEKFTDTARKVVFFARYEASQFGTPQVLPEHLLLGVLREDRALRQKLLGESAVVEAIRHRIEQETTRGEKLATSVDLPVSESGKRALAFAAEEAEHFHHSYIGTEHLLVGLMREESLAARVLSEQGVTLEKVRAEAALSTPPQESSSPARRFIPRWDPPPEPRTKSEPVLRDVTMLAMVGELEPLIGRERELERLVQVLSRRHRKNAVLVGEPGVGKTAIVEGLAQRIARGSAPPELAQRKVVAVDAAALIAPGGAPELTKLPPEAILFIHGLFDVAVAGYSWGILNVTRVLEPLLARIGWQAIATGTPAGYRTTMAKAPALALHFEAIAVLPPDDQQALEMLRGVKGLYEKHHDVTISEEAIETAVAASARFLRHRFLPDRALDLLDEACARVSLRRAGGSSPEELQIRRRIRVAIHKMENAIAMHEFERAREFAEHEKLEQQKLRELQEQQVARIDNVVGAQDVVAVAAARAGAPVSVIENVLRQPDAGEIERIAKELIAAAPQCREWLEPLAVYLAGCTADELEKFAAVIRSRKMPKE